MAVCLTDPKQDYSERTVNFVVANPEWTARTPQQRRPQEPSLGASLFAGALAASAGGLAVNRPGTGTSKTPSAAMRTTSRPTGNVRPSAFRQSRMT